MHVKGPYRALMDVLQRDCVTAAGGIINAPFRLVARIVTEVAYKAITDDLFDANLDC